MIIFVGLLIPCLSPPIRAELRMPSPSSVLSLVQVHQVQVHQYFCLLLYCLFPLLFRNASAPLLLLAAFRGACVLRLSFFFLSSVRDPGACLGRGTQACAGGVRREEAGPVVCC